MHDVREVSRGRRESGSDEDRGKRAPGPDSGELNRGPRPCLPRLRRGHCPGRLPRAIREYLARGAEGVKRDEGRDATGGAISSALTVFFRHHIGTPLRHGRNRAELKCLHTRRIRNKERRMDDFSLSAGMLRSILSHAKPLGHHEEERTLNLGFGLRLQRGMPRPGYLRTTPSDQ